MKILHVIRSSDPEFGGPIEGILRQCEVADGSARELLSLDDPGANYLPAVRGKLPTFAAGKKFGAQIWSRYGFSWSFVRWLRAHRHHYSVVVVNGVWNFSSFGTWLALRRSQTPYVVFTHGMLDPWFARAYPVKTALKRLWWLLVEHRVMRDAKAVFYTTQEEQHLARLTFQPYDFTERVVGYGTAAPPPIDRLDVERFRASVPGLGHRPYLLFLSRIHRKKGCDILIEAFSRISQQYPHHMLVMAGPDQTGWKRELQFAAQAAGIEGRILWPGMLTGTSKWAAYGGAEAFVLPSHSENFGIVVAEALAMGLPVILTDKVNIWREVEVADAGLVATDTVDSYSDKLQEFLALPKERREVMSRNARECFLENFDVQNTSIRLVAALSEIVASRDRV